MSDATIEYQYNGETITVQGKDNESMKIFYERFANKAAINAREKGLIFSYNGDIKLIMMKPKLFYKLQIQQMKLGKKWSF